MRSPDFLNSLEAIQLPSAISDVVSFLAVIISFANKLLAWNALSEVAVIDDLPCVVQLIEQRRASWDIQLQHLFAGELL